MLCRKLLQLWPPRRDISSDESIEPVFLPYAMRQTNNDDDLSCSVSINDAVMLRQRKRQLTNTQNTHSSRRREDACRKSGHQVHQYVYVEQ